MKLDHTLACVKRKFRDENGSFSVEAALMFPMLIWGFVAMFVFFEGLRESNINLKATYTISDLISRENALIDQEYVDGMTNVYAWLSRSQNAVNTRVTIVRYDAAQDQHVLVCSLGAGQTGLVQEQIAAKVTPNVPIMANADTAIVVETWATFTPLLEIGLTETEIYNLVVTSPRFAGSMTCDGVGDGTGSEHNDGTIDPDDQVLEAT